MARRVRIGTRGSALALTQATWVADQLRRAWPDLAVETRVIQTTGDRSQASNTPLSVIGGQGIFVKEIEHALNRDEIDVAVHSLKDLATTLEEGLVLAAVPPREDARDVLVSRHHRPLADLPPTPRIGTSSPRRAALARVARPDAVIVNLRGNLDTRLRKAGADDYDAIILAAAGLHRLGRADAITEYLTLDTFIPMVGQAALGLEARVDDQVTRALLAPLDDRATHLAARAERAFLARLGSGCSAPVAAHAVVQGDSVRLRAMLAHPTGARVARDEALGAAEDGERLGAALADRLLAAGGSDIVAARRQ